MPTHLKPADQALYTSIYDEIVASLHPIDQKEFRMTKPKVFRLSRYVGRVASWWPIYPTVTCAYPLYLYYSIIRKSGQHNSAQDVFKITKYIQDNFIKFLPPEYRSDAWRQYLKQISAHCFPKVFTHGPVYMLFVHMHWLTAKCPYTEEQIISDIEEWVAGNIDGKEKHLDSEMTEKVLDRVFSSWYHGEPDGALKFREYCNDYTRWGTSGGAPKVNIMDVDYRSKWAWALYHTTDPITGDLKHQEIDLYEEALKCRTTSTIALKEEPAKTREIITTTMASYLRQSYLMYRWGKPRIPSPISQSTWQGKFERMEPTWFGSIDGERFDHCIPKEFITGIVRRLGSLDEETRFVADEEIGHMESLKVEWQGNIWDWKGGLLSGWRLTSVIGSLASCCVAEYILETTQSVGSVYYGVMGDDLILYSYYKSIDVDEMVTQYKNFGLKANFHKTTSGKVGEFLRRVISKGGTWAYPALGLRSVCYANPWLDHYTYNEETEVSNTWLTVLSRMLPHALDKTGLTDFILHHCVKNLTQLFGVHNWYHWLRTPISAGGGGTIEISDVNNWVYFDKIHDTTRFGKNMYFKMLYGLLPYSRVLKTNPEMKKMDLEPIIRLDSVLVGSEKAIPDTFFKHNVNITKLIYDYVYGRIGVGELQKGLAYALPRGLRVSSPQRVVSFLLQGSKLFSGITTIQHTKESLHPYANIAAYAVRAISTSKRYVNMRYLPAAVTMYMSQLVRNVYIPYGTW